MQCSGKARSNLTCALVRSQHAHTLSYAAAGESVIIGVVFLSLGKSDSGLGALQLHGQSMTSAAPSSFVPNWNRVKVILPFICYTSGPCTHCEG